MNIKIVTLFSLLFFSNHLFGHGMNKPGPNGGFIKMPGAFHTELVDAGKEMKVFLLDIALKNPIVENSSVKILYKGANEVEYNCNKANNYFVCPKPNEGLKNQTEIVINSSRQKSRGQAVYALPLKLEGEVKILKVEEEVKDPHAHH